MPVEHTPTGKVHKGSKGGTTGCGENTNVYSSHGVSTSNSVNCEKNGLKIEREMTIA